MIYEILIENNLNVSCPFRVIAEQRFDFAKLCFEKRVVASEQLRNETNEQVVFS